MTANSGRLPPTSLIVCSRDRPHMLLGVVESVLAGQEIPTEIVVIDDSSVPNDSLLRLQTDLPVAIRYIWSQSRGLSRANNRGIREAEHDVLVFTQDDVLVEPTWFEALVRALMREGRRTVVTGRVLPTEAETAGGFAPSNVEDEFPVVYEGRVRRDVLFVQNMALYRDAVVEVGSFDERLGPGTPFPASEDNDFCFRLLEAGYRIIYNPAAVVYHRAWRSERDFLPLRWYYGVSRGAYYAKYFGTRDNHMLRRMAIDLRDHAGNLPGRLRSDYRGALGDAALSAGMLYGAIRWLLTEWRAKST